MNIINKIDYKKIFIFFILALIITLGVFLFVFCKQAKTGQYITEGQICEAAGGKWFKEFRECEYISKEWCGQNNGIFQECASACRHDGEAKICTMQCVPVCVLDIKEKLFSRNIDDAVYSIDGFLVDLCNREEEKSSTPDNVLNEKIKIWGIRATGDLNGDNIDDAAMILAQKLDNNNTRYYVVVCLFDLQANKYLGTNAIFLGEGVSPEKIEVKNGEIFVKYDIRAKDENGILQSPQRVVMIAKIEGENNLVKIDDRYSYKDEIYVEIPFPGEKIKSPLVVMGAARGSWFFEGDFPVILTNWDGLIIAEGYASALDDWMSEDYVNFSAELNFEVPELYDRGALILQKDNPSGLPENDDAFEFNVFFDLDTSNID